MPGTDIFDQVADKQDVFDKVAPSPAAPDKTGPLYTGAGMENPPDPTRTRPLDTATLPGQRKTGEAPNILTRATELTTGMAHPIDQLIGGEIPMLVSDPKGYGRALGGNLYRVAQAPGNAIEHPIDTGKALIGAPQWREDIDAKRYGAAAGDVLGGAANVMGLAKATKPVGEAAITKVSQAGRAIRESAMEDPQLARLKALGVSANSPDAASTLRSAETASPYLKGARTQAEAQARLPQAESEVWEPRQKVIDTYGSDVVLGPEGTPTTIAELESERRQLSAMNRGLRTRDPMAAQLATQKGLTQADALAREDAINEVLDKAISDRGVNSSLTRQTYAGLADVRGQLEGRRGGMQTAPMGLGKIVRGARIGAGVGEGGEIQGHGGFISEPLHRIGQAARDITAGRGWWSGSPADISMREGFRVGGDLPDLSTPRSFETRGLLGQGAIPMGPAPDTSGPIRGEQPPIYPGTRAGRLGLLLGQGATQLPERMGEGDSSVRGYQAPPISVRGAGGAFSRGYSSSIGPQQRGTSLGQIAKIGNERWSWDGDKWYRIEP